MTPGNCSRITVMRRSALRPATSACAVSQGSSRVYQHAALARSSHEGRPHLSAAHGAASSSGRVDAGLTSIPTQQQCSCCDSGHSHQVLMPHPPRHSTEALASRRSMLWLAAAGAGAAAAPAADAAPTLSSIAPPGATSAVSRLIQALPFQLPGGSRLPGPVRFPRKALDQRFAVLLMRSSYDAVNLLDFIPMDQFEARFWKLRQGELEGYTQLYAPLKMRAGVLEDPMYFDFISFSQYATINAAMRAPAKVFTERYEACEPGTPEDAACGTSTSVIRRPPQYDDDAMLPLYLFETAGNLMYQGLRDGFRGEVFGGPGAAPPGAGLQELVTGVRQLLDIMVDRGYAISAKVTAVPAGGKAGPKGGFRVEVQGPANLWALKALGARQAKVANAYDAMIVAAWLRASGVDADYQLRLVDAGLEVDWTLL